MRREAGFIDGGTAGCVIARPDPTFLALALQDAPDASGDGVCQMIQLSTRRAFTQRNRELDPVALST